MSAASERDGRAARAAEAGEGDPALAAFDPETALVIATSRRLTELLPEHRRLIGLLVALLRGSEETRAQALSLCDRSARQSEREADAAVARLTDESEVLEHQLVDAFRQLPIGERHDLVDQVRALVDGDESGATRAAFSVCSRAGRRRRRAAEERRRRFVAQAIEKGAPTHGGPPGDGEAAS